MLNNKNTSEDLNINKAFLKDFIKILDERALNFGEFAYGTKSIRNSLHVIRNGKLNARLSTIVYACNLLGVDLVLKPRHSAFSSYVDDCGYVVIEHNYSPYVRLRVNPDDCKDFSIISSSYKHTGLQVLKYYRVLFVWYFRRKMLISERVAVNKIIKKSLEGKNVCVKHIDKSKESLYRGRRDI